MSSAIHGVGDAAVPGIGKRHHDGRLDTGVELALTLSYQHLAAEHQRLLRLAALHPGQDFDAYAAAALTGTDLNTVRTWIDNLRRDHMLQQTSPHRYTFHDLVRAYAAGRAQDQDPPAERRAARTRLFDHYLATAAAAMNTLYPADAHRRPQVPAAGTPAPDLTDPDAAIAWLDTERPTLVAVAAHTATRGWPGHTTRLAGTLARYLAGGYRADALILHGHAIHAARDRGDLTEEANALVNLGYAHLGLSHTGWGADYFRQALDLFRQVGDPAGQARALGNLGMVAERSGDYAESIDCKRQALALFRQAGDRTGEASALNGLGVAMRWLGRYPEAIDHYQQALTLARQVGNQYGEVLALNNLGEVEAFSGRHGPARDHLRQALALSRQLRNRAGEAAVLDSLGVLHTRLGQPDQAIEYYQQALTIFRETGDQFSKTHVLNSLGEAALAAGRPDDALTRHTAACAIAIDTGDRRQQARALAGRGHAHRTLGDPAEARADYQQALTLYADLDVHEADRIRAGLAELDTNDAEQEEARGGRPGPDG